MGKVKPKNWIVGRWLIESMEQWDRDFIDEEVRGYFEFDAKDSGDFQFGLPFNAQSKHDAQASAL